ncbi:hypothetical protein SNE40_011446 [Patella caerulea]|uniref:C2 domain-containing protein n=1 Tax=Patella caerulea TaxID=87958 RepID=A0AAN8JPX7_PATCE
MSDQSQLNKYLPSFLLRRHRRRDSTERTPRPRDKVRQLKYDEAVTQSLGNLVNVASSVPLPAGATHRVKPRGTSLQIPKLDCLIHGHVRRHSYDCAVTKSKHPVEKIKQYDSDRDSSGRSSGSDRNGSNLSIGQSTSTEVSPVHRKSQKVEGHALGISRRSAYSDQGHSTSVNTSDKESDIDDDYYMRSSRLIPQKHGPGVFNLSEDDSDFFSHRTSSYTSQESSTRQRQNAQMQHVFFVLEVRLQEGRDLVVRDSCGTSDPYVKFKYNGKQVYKSRTVYKNLNPRWEDVFTVPVEDICKPLQMKVFDYDRGMTDDPMGSAEIDLSTLELNKATELKCMLSDQRGKADYMGYLVLNCKIIPKSQEEKDQFFRKSLKMSDSSKKLKSQIWNSVVTIVLVSGKNLVPMDDNGLSDPYVKFRLGNEKYKSKFKSKTLNPSWLEQFDLRMFDDQTSQLEITIFDHDVTGKDDFMGRAMIDLASLAGEKTHTLETPLEDGAGIIKLLLTISGTAGNETITDLSNYTPNPKEREELLRHYGLAKSFNDIKDVGWLQVKVFKANGLKAADFGGLSDPFCVLELVNSRLQTQTEYKTLNPDWNKVFTFNVKDIHSVLDITVYDEDRDKKVEFLGKLSIPLLKIKLGERRWYALKDKKLLHKTKGAIMLEMDFVFNHVKAAIRTVNPREEKYMQGEQKFKISIMKRNIDRVSQIAAGFVEGGKFLQSCFDWESKPRSIIAFIVYLVVVWIFEPYMLPITLLIVFLKNLIIAQILGAFKNQPVEDDYVDEDDDDDDETQDKEEKKSFKEKLQAIQEVCLQVQQGMDMVASMGERVKNTFNWTVPWLSALAVVVLMVGGLVLYYVPIRFLLIAWGINKFTKKLRKPDAIPNNELLDFLSRVPSDSELIQYRDLRPDMSAIQVSKKKRA